MTPYLVIDPKIVANPRPLDPDEDIEIVRGVDLATIWTLIKEGRMNLVGGWACMLAIEKLRELDEL